MKKVLKEMIRITRHALILLEQYSFESLCKNKDPHGLGIYHLGCWKRNYVASLKQFAREEQIHVTVIPKDVWHSKDWAELGAIVEVIME